MADELSIVASHLRGLERELRARGRLPAPMGELLGLADRLSPLFAAAPPGAEAEIFLDLAATLWQIAALTGATPAAPGDLAPRLAKIAQARPDLYYAVGYDALVGELLAQRDAAGGLPDPETWRPDFGDYPRDAQDALREVDAAARGLLPSLAPAGFEPLDHAVMLYFDWYAWNHAPRAGVERPDPADALRELVAAAILRRYRLNRVYRPTGTKVLLGYSATTDYPIEVTTAWLDDAIAAAAKLEGKTREEIVRELGEGLAQMTAADGSPLPRAAVSLRETVLFTLAYVALCAAHPEQGFNSRFDLTAASPAELWDLVDALLALAGTGELGGGAATGAAALATLGEKWVDLVVPFLQPILDQVLAAGARILWYECLPAGPRLIRLTSLSGARGQPEARNFVPEFQAGRRLIFCKCCGAGPTARKTDRTVGKNKFMWYTAGNRVDRNQTAALGHRLAVRSLFGFDCGVTDAVRDTLPLAQEAADERYAVFALSGLQSLKDHAHARAVEELKLFRAKGTQLHVEIAGTAALPRLFAAAPGLFHSVGIGEELADALKEAWKQAAAANPAEAARQADVIELLAGQPAGFHQVVQALELRRHLGAERFYYHGELFDITVWRGNLPLAARLQEVEACLIAKWVVLRKLMARCKITTDNLRDPATRLRREGLEELFATCAAIEEAFLGAPAPEAPLYGVYIPQYDATVILTPVRWVYGALQAQLRIIGAGDTSSIISAVRSLAARATKTGVKA